MISIIVPVYNAEYLLEKCIKSLLSQTYTDIELVLVNDGSTDQSESICRKYEKQDKRVVCISKENGGVSSARNIGIQKARGEYLTFVDADDYLLPTALERSINIIEKNAVDGVLFGYSDEGDLRTGGDMTSLLNCCQMQKEGACVQTSKVVNQIVSITPNQNIAGYVFRVIYLTSIIRENEIKFDESLKIAEDYKYINEYLLYTNKIYVLPEVLYIKNTNDMSTCAKYVPTMHTDMNAVNNWMRDKVLGSFPEVKQNLDESRCNTYKLTVQNLCTQGTTYRMTQRIREASHIKYQYGYNDLLKKARENKKNARKTRIAFWIFSLGLDWLFIILYSIKRKTLFSR